MNVGYARTSTVDQLAGHEAQERDLRAAGCEKLFAERVSSVAKRSQLEAALDFVREGDTLMVTKPDRLARSTADLLIIVTRLEAKSVGLVVLSMGGQKVDTRTATGKLMLTMLAAIATFERDLMLERQREGIAKAKGEGWYKGRAHYGSRQGREGQGTGSCRTDPRGDRSLRHWGGQRVSDPAGLGDLTHQCLVARAGDQQDDPKRPLSIERQLDLGVVSCPCGSQ